MGSGGGPVYTTRVIIIIIPVTTVSCAHSVSKRVNNNNIQRFSYTPKHGDVQITIEVSIVLKRPACACVYVRV